MKETFFIIQNTFITYKSNLKIDELKSIAEFRITKNYENTRQKNWNQKNLNQCHHLSPLSVQEQMEYLHTKKTLNMRTKNGQIFGDLQNQLKILDEINGIP